MRLLFVFSFLLLSLECWALASSPNFPDQGIASQENGGFLDERIDYTRFPGRATDKDETGHILKVKTENNNSKFLKIGDEVSFHLPNKSARFLCKGHVRSVEDFYFSIYVNDFALCFDDENYFKRGTALSFISETMARRIYEASEYRTLLIKRRKDYLHQLNEINHFLWAYDQERVKTAADWDKKILDMQREKEKAMDNLLLKRRESFVLQTDLKKKLDQMDDNLKHYYIERQELMTDRWNLDHDMGLPVGQRPQDIRARYQD